MRDCLLKKKLNKTLEPFWEKGKKHLWVVFGTIRYEGGGTDCGKFLE